MIFAYRAKDSQGRVHTGTLEAPDLNNAQELLAEQNFAIISLEDTGEEDKKNIGQLAIFDRVGERDKVVFARQLSVMISANLPVVKALRILIDQTQNQKLKSIISEVADEVNGGAKLSSSLGHHPEVFSNFFISMIKTGETSGKLDEVLNYLADQQEKDYDLISKVRGAMVYPIFITSGLIVVGTLMMIFVIPKLTAMLAESGAELPFTTRMLIATSNAFRNQWWVLVILLALFIVAIFYTKKSKSGAKYWSYISLRIPVFGKLLKKIYIVRFMRSMATLLEGGVLLVDSLKIVAEVISDVTYKEIILATAKEVEDGNSIATVLSKRDEIPTMIPQMLAIGEQTGSLVNVLKKVSDFFSRDIDNMVANLTTLLEPIIMIVMGVAVGIMVAAIILPMYDLANSFG